MSESARAQVHHALALAVRRFGHGNDRLRDAVALRVHADARDAAQHLDADQVGAALAQVVVEHADHAPLRTACELLDERRGGGAGADHERRRSLRLCDEGRQMTFAPRAVGEPAATHREREQRRRDEVDRTRHELVEPQHGEQRRHRERRDADRDHDPLQVRQAGVAPHAAVQAERPENHRVQRDDERQAREHRLGIVRRHVEVEAQPVGDQPGGAGGDEVVTKDEEAAEVHA